MRIPSFDKRLEPAFRELAQALGRLDAAQGLVGRRNARQALSKAERKLRRRVDGMYPTIKRKSKPRRKPLTVQQRGRKWELEGWCPVASVPLLERITNAGIKTKRLKGEGGWADGSFTRTSISPVIVWPAVGCNISAAGLSCWALARLATAKRAATTTMEIRRGIGGLLGCECELV